MLSAKRRVAKTIHELETDCISVELNVTHTVGVSEIMVANNPEDILVTRSLGSCVGLTPYDPTPCVGGTTARTMYLYMAAGETRLKISGEERPL